MTSSAAMELPSADPEPRTRTVSPTCNSCTPRGVAFFRSFSPGASRRMRAAGCTVTETSGPDVDVRVNVLPLISLIVPMRFAIAGCASCAQAAGWEKLPPGRPSAKAKIASMTAVVFFIRPLYCKPPESVQPHDLQSFTQRKTTVTKLVREVATDVPAPREPIDGARSHS